MRFSCVILAAAVLMLAVPARAQSTYVPTSAWLVGPASLGATLAADIARVPCVVANQYNNGFVLRFSGGDGKLLALAIDFKKKAFKPNQKYDAELDVPGAFFQAIAGTAYDETTIIFNLQKVDGLYNVLKSADMISLKIYNTALPFSLMGLADGFKRMEVCSTPTVQGPAPMAPPVAPNPRGIPAQAIGGTPQNPLIAEAEGLMPMPGEATVPARALTTEASPQANPVPALMAKAQQAEQVAKTLVAKDPQAAGSAPIAPTQPQGSQLAKSWTDPTAPKDQISTDIMGKEITRGPQPGKETYVRREMRWRALKGANLREVLRVWTEGSGTQLIWLSSRDFAVQRSMSQQSTIEVATQALLEQFGDSTPRPIGRMYREPGTSRLVLVIESEEAP